MNIAGRGRLERETGIEPATNSLEGCDSTIELLPLGRSYSFYYRSSARDDASATTTRFGRIWVFALPGFMSTPCWNASRSRRRSCSKEGENAGSEFRQEPGSRRLANLVAKGKFSSRSSACPKILAVHRSRSWTGVQVQQPERALGQSLCRTRCSRCMSTLERSRTTRATGSATPYGCWMISLRRTARSASCLDRTVGGDCRDAQHPDETLVTGQAGTVVVMNAHCWHGGTANRTERDRRALHAFYCRSDKPQQQYQQALIPSRSRRRFTS